MKIRRLAAVVAGTFLALAAATGSTQAQVGSGSSAGALQSSLGSWADSARFPKAVHPAHQMCDEVPYSAHHPSPAKG
ncbi:MAG: hypothetical protein H0U61_02660 [Nocardioidaceae bacterium]|nr:hypothetical protein [Nocardioidaceae bacterium]